MKKRILVIFLFTAYCGQAQIVAIPDANFKNALVNTFCLDLDDDGAYDADADANNNGEIELTEALAVSKLSVYFQNISSLEGIQSFTNLQHLGCDSNQLTELPISNLTNLITLSCYDNNLAELVIENLLLLETLYIADNALTQVNFQNHPNLTAVWCSDNLFTEINFCGTAVVFLSCGNNPLLQTVIIKNNVISPEYAGARLIPPPPPTLYFWNLPALETICYDEGELPAIYYGTSDAELEGVTLTTDCVVDCALLANTNFAASDLAIYPNPAEDYVMIESGNAVVTLVSIYNNLGQLVQSNSRPEEGRAVDVSGLASGSYFVDIISDKGETTKKLLKR